VRPPGIAPSRRSQRAPARTADRFVRRRIVEDDETNRDRAGAPEPDAPFCQSYSLPSLQGPGMLQSNWKGRTVTAVRPRYRRQHSYRRSDAGYSSIVFRVSLAKPQVSARRVLEDDLAPPATEITSSHGVDKRSLLPLAARARCRSKGATSRMALEAATFSFCRDFYVACIRPAARAHGVAHPGASTLTSRSIPGGYGHDSFTRLVAGASC
jgi:hypothetical protein